MGMYGILSLRLIHVMHALTSSLIKYCIISVPYKSTLTVLPSVKCRLCCYIIEFLFFFSLLGPPVQPSVRFMFCFTSAAATPAAVRLPGHPTYARVSGAASPNEFS